MLASLLSAPLDEKSLEDEWNASEFAQQLARAKLGKDYKRLKKLLTQVADSNYKLRTLWRVPRTISITHSECSDFKATGAHCPSVSFSTMSTVDALLYFGRHKHHLVCGLNFANGKDVGGGYKNGATAQEEDLCRRIPALYTSLHRANQAGLYPFGPSTCSSPHCPERYSDVLYTADLTVARRGEEEGFGFLPKAEQVQVSLVAAAAPNTNFAKDVNEPELVYRTIQTIFLAPKIAQPEVATLILGAWGCGAFGGDPVEIAKLFVQAIVRDNLGQLYTELHFAIPKTSPSDVNYDTFREVFQSYRVEVKDL